jgi:hypothetical protein
MSEERQLIAGVETEAVKIEDILDNILTTVVHIPGRQKAGQEELIRRIHEWTILQTIQIVDHEDRDRQLQIHKEILARLQCFNLARQTVINWYTKQGHERCHYYPELFRQLCIAFGITVHDDFKDLPSLEEFNFGCQRFQCELYGEVINEQGERSTCGDEGRSGGQPEGFPENAGGPEVQAD